MNDARLPSTHIEQQAAAEDFSGVIYASKNHQVIYGKAFGLANRADEISNEIDTRFAIASGSKLFTAIAVCQLVDKGLLSFTDRLSDCLDNSFPRFSPEVTVHHLLTHSAGIPDYWDEENQDFEELWRKHPPHLMKSPADFLPMFREAAMRDEPGRVFKYNDAGFILLGLIVERKSGLRFQEYVHKNIFATCEMSDSGYFESDSLPPRTARGYVEDKDTGHWKTNIFSVPIIGGPDGGAYTTAPDLNKLWIRLLAGSVLSKELTRRLLMPHIEATDEGENLSYGYGIWIRTSSGQPRAYFIGGWDPGVNMLSEYHLDGDFQFSILGNTNQPILPLRESILSCFLSS